jgi:hypothetical protein
LLGLSSFGLSLFYCGEIQLCKIKAEKYADNDHIEKEQKLIVFSSGAKGVKLVNEHEILANGKMYDIVKTKLHNGTVLYYAVSDTDEDDFVLDLTWLEKGGADQSVPAKIIKLYDLKYFDIENKFIPTGTWSALLPGLKPVNGHMSYPSPFRDIFSPPPNRLLS